MLDYDAWYDADTDSVILGVGNADVRIPIDQVEGVSRELLRVAPGAARERKPEERADRVSEALEIEWASDDQYDQLCVFIGEADVALPIIASGDALESFPRNGAWKAGSLLHAKDPTGKQYILGVVSKGYNVADDIGCFFIQLAAPFRGDPELLNHLSIWYNGAVWGVPCGGGMKVTKFLPGGTLAATLNKNY